MSRAKRIAAARTALAAISSAQGTQDAALASIEVLRAKDGPIFEACARVIRAGNAPRAIELLDRVGGGPPPPEPPEGGVSGGGGAAGALSWAAWGVWITVAAVLWLVYPGLVLSIVLVAVAWAVSLAALASGGAVARRAYESYSGLGEYLGALVFLAFPLMLPLGLIWTVARALRIRSGRVDGPGYGPSPGGGYAGFEVGHIGAAGRPIARAMLAIAAGHTAAIAAVVVHSGVIESIQSSSGG